MLLVWVVLIVTSACFHSVKGFGTVLVLHAV